MWRREWILGVRVEATGTPMGDVASGGNRRARRDCPRAVVSTRALVGLISSRTIRVSTIRPGWWRRVRPVIALGSVFTWVGAGVVGPGAGVAFADCPAPSWIQVVTDQANLADPSDPTGRLDSRFPGAAIQADASTLLRHWGDVKPGTRARFGYDSYNAAGQFLGGFSWTTQPARDNGVIHHEDELALLGNLSVSVANEVRISFLFTDECTGNVSSGSGGATSRYWTIYLVHDADQYPPSPPTDPDPCPECPPLEY
jgi:hypothetical protein